LVYSEPVKLNLGCSINYLQNYVNIDIRLEVKADLHIDITQKLPYEDCSVDEVRMVHVIEHVNFVDGQRVIDDVYRVLKEGGLLELSTPNLLYLAELIVKGEMEKSVQNPYTIMYGSPEENIYQLHRSAYTPKTLRALLSRFKNYKEEYIYHEIRVKAQK
jgi:predicted SAM-dependent methyltransferase